MKLIMLFASLVAIVMSNSPNVLQQIARQESSQSPQNVSPAADASDSRNWAGYSSTNGTFSGIGATWTIPNGNNANNTDYGIDATWVGIGGVQNNDLIQAGTQQTVSPDGNTSYTAFYERLPDASQPLSVDINGGDSVTVAISENSKNLWHIVFKDNTSGQTADMTIPYTSSHSSADWIEEAPSTTQRILPIDNFGSIQFSDAWAMTNHQKKSLSQTNPQAIQMGDDDGQTLAVASTMQNNGTSFTVSRTDAQPNESAPETSGFGSTNRSGRGFHIRIHRTFFMRR